MCGAVSLHPWESEAVAVGVSVCGALEIMLFLRPTAEGRQSVLFSATRGGEVERLANAVLGKGYKEVDVTVHKVEKLGSNIVHGRWWWGCVGWGRVG